MGQRYSDAALKVFRNVLLALGVGFVPGVTANAEDLRPAHGISMHSTPKYKPDARKLDYVSESAVVGGRLRLAKTGTFDSLNPYILKGKAATGHRLVIESLLARTRDEPFALYGLIAESVNVPEDRSWIEFTLRPEARFHDGSPITVEDVLFSFTSLKEKGRPNVRLFYGKVSDVRLTGPRSIRFDFAPEDRDRELPLIMGFMPIFSKAFHADVEFTSASLVPFLASGPYRVGEIVPGRSISYERVPNYWAKDLFFNRHRNNFASVRYEYFRDQNIMFEAFKAGEVDVFEEHSSSRWARGYDFPAVRSGDVIRSEIPIGRPAEMRGFILNARKKQFADPQVRQALGLAFDFDWINKNLLFNDYQRTTSYFAESEFEASGSLSAREKELLGTLPDVPLEALEPVSTELSGGNLRSRLLRARGLLRTAGWSVRDGQLLHEDDGINMRFEILLLNQRDKRLALAWARNLKRLGVRIDVRVVDSSQYQLRRQNYEFDVILDGWELSHSPGNELHYYWGSAAADEVGTRNYPGIRSKAVDHLIDAAIATTGRADFALYLKALDRVLMAGHYIVPLFHRRTIRMAFWRGLHHPDPMPPITAFPRVWWKSR